MSDFWGVFGTTADVEGDITLSIDDILLLETVMPLLLDVNTDGFISTDDLSRIEDIINTVNVSQNPPPIVPVDVDDNGALETADILLLQQALDTIRDYDVNRDGHIDNTDISQVDAVLKALQLPGTATDTPPADIDQNGLFSPTDAALWQLLTDPLIDLNAPVLSLPDLSGMEDSAVYAA
jgi:hypothetical protein